MALESLQDLLLDELRDLYDAELQIAKAIPRMLKRVRTPALRNALNDHLEDTEAQVARLEQVFDHLGVRGTGRKSRAMHGLLEEGRDLLEVDGSSAVRDAALIAAIQRVEHYEIATYGTVITHAQLLGHTRTARILEQSLDEEKRADERLTRIAEEQVNRVAAEVGRYARDRTDDERLGDDRLGDDRLSDDRFDRDRHRDHDYDTRYRGEDSWSRQRLHSRR